MVVNINTEYKFFLLYFILGFINTSLFGFNTSDTLETTTLLNLRSEPNLESEVIVKLNKGDTLIVDEDLGEWVKVYSSKHKGFVSAEYVEKVAPLGFYDWFKDGWLYGSMGVFLLVFGGQVAAARVKDNRFEGGYRQGIVGEGKLIKAFLGAGALGLLIGLGYAVYMWIKN